MCSRERTMEKNSCLQRSGRGWAKAGSWKLGPQCRSPWWVAESPSREPSLVASHRLHNQEGRISNCSQVFNPDTLDVWDAGVLTGILPLDAISKYLPPRRFYLNDWVWAEIRTWSFPHPCCFDTTSGVLRCWGAVRVPTSVLLLELGRFSSTETRTMGKQRVWKWPRDPEDRGCAHWLELNFAARFW